MELLILYADNSELSYQAEERLRQLLVDFPYYSLTILRYPEDFHTQEYPLPYLKVEERTIFGESDLNEFVSHHYL